jgi:hypothetical protein
MERPRDFEPVADIEIDEVRPGPGGFTLSGPGNDRADYQVALHFGMPLDSRTRAVLGELLSQAEVSIVRRPAPAGSRAEAAPRRVHRDRAHR